MIARIERRGRRQHGAKCVYCNKRHGDGAPWWNESKQGWSLTYRTPEGKSRNRLLAKGRDGHDEAIQLWKDMLAADGELPFAESGEDTTIEALVAQRLAYLKDNAGLSAFKNAESILNDFCYHETHGFAKTTIRELRDGGIARIKRWVAAHHWNDSTKNLVYGTLKALFNYATDKSEDSLGIIETSPIARLNTGRTRVKSRARLTLFSAEQEAAILQAAEPNSASNGWLRRGNPEFALAFRVLIATGVRPEEFCTLTAADVRKDTSGELYWLVKHKNIKRTGNKRRVYLTPEVQRITAERMELRPSGTLFNNCTGRPWDIDCLYRALRRITSRKECVALGLNDYDLGRRTDGSAKKEYHYVIYTCRHTFAHRHLSGFYKRADGTPIVLNYGEVGELMGNTAAEVERTYGKLVKATTHLSRLLHHA